MVKLSPSAVLTDEWSHTSDQVDFDGKLFNPDWCKYYTKTEIKHSNAVKSIEVTVICVQSITRRIEANLHFFVLYAKQVHVDEMLIFNWQTVHRFSLIKEVLDILNYATFSNYVKMCIYLTKYFICDRQILQGKWVKQQRTKLSEQRRSIHALCTY